MFIVNRYVVSSVRTNTASSGIVTNLPGEQADEDLAGVLGSDPGSLEHIGSGSVSAGSLSFVFNGASWRAV
jgi:hypothetical protein